MPITRISLSFICLNIEASVLDLQNAAESVRPFHLGYIINLTRGCLPWNPNFEKIPGFTFLYPISGACDYVCCSSSLMFHT